MNQLVISIPDDQFRLMVDAICEAGRFAPNLRNQQNGEVTPNPTSREQFAANHLLQICRNMGVQHVTRKAAAAARTEFDRITIDIQKEPVGPGR